MIRLSTAAAAYSPTSRESQYPSEAKGKEQQRHLIYCTIPCSPSASASSSSRRRRHCRTPGPTPGVYATSQFKVGGLAISWDGCIRTTEDGRACLRRLSGQTRGKEERDEGCAALSESSRLTLTQWSHSAQATLSLPHFIFILVFNFCFSFLLCIIHNFRFESIILCLDVHSDSQSWHATNRSK